MTPRQVLDWFKRDRLVPVIRASSPDSALQMVEGLADGGIRIVEITMTVPGAVDVIRLVSERFQDEVLVGAGTVLNAATAAECRDAGAQFIVSPAFDPDTVAFCKQEGIAVAPGALTPTEVLSAWHAGADVVKIFPADAVGGPAYIRALRAPLPQVPLMPTGGVTLENAAAFLQAGAVAIGVGSNLADPKLSREALSERARRFVAAIRSV